MPQNTRGKKNPGNRPRSTSHRGEEGDDGQEDDQIDSEAFLVLVDLPRPRPKFLLSIHDGGDLERRHYRYRFGKPFISVRAMDQA